MCRFAKLSMTVACLGMLISPVSSAGDRPVRTVTDIQLSGQGTLVGTVVNAQGRSVAKSPVVIRYGGTVIARATTNAHGRFAVEGLRGGVHHLQTSHTSQAVRFWARGTAPSSARTTALVVSDRPLIRAQNCAEDSCTGCTGCAETDCAEGCGTACGLFGGGAGGLGGSSLLVGGLAVAGIAAAVAIAANDDDDNPPASP